ncbi:hypothetical protein [Lentzea albida]|uniref:Uncharacterized protein n=1 Tax=Lentzea albida TaxID=65499 RepID=A0A1H9AG37_9PSEU|nr:hypothetical protein [Lentzea albida]SEP75742.1 hypothetical protein SAMN04488000_101151 [Lentzea albida]
MSWLRRLLLLAGLVTGAWLLGGAGQANADVRVEIDQLKIELELPVVDIGIEVVTAQARPDVLVPPKPDPRVEPPAPPAEPQPVPTQVEAPARPEVPKQQQLHTPPQPAPPTTTQPTNPEPAPQQPQPQAEQPVPGTLPQSGAGSGTSNQIPAGTLPHVPRPPAATASPICPEQQDVPHTVRAEEPTFSPD